VLAASDVRGVQSEGVFAVVKHFVGNDAEFERASINSVIDERSLRRRRERGWQVGAASHEFLIGVRPMTSRTTAPCGYPTPRAGVREQSCRTTSNP
jgi:beta-glucosidase-like glycosyl hydrolase